MIQQPINEEDAVRSEDQANEDHTAQAEAAQEEQEAPQEDTEQAAEGDDAFASTEGDADLWRDKYLRLYAEFDNFRKRTMRERGDLVRSAGRDVMEALLPVLDDFERALAAGEGQELEQMKEGYLLIGQKMRGILEAKGLQRMEAKEAAFDTDLHEAITQIPAPEPSMVGKVVDVVEPGYKLHDSVLRFAKVVVGN